MVDSTRLSFIIMTDVVEQGEEGLTKSALKKKAKEEEKARKKAEKAAKVKEAEQVREAAEGPVR